MTTTGFVRLLHITDLHAKSTPWPTDIDEKEKLAGRPVGQTRDVSFRRMLGKALGKEENWPKAILVTGDVVNMGGTDEGEFERAREFLHALAGDLHVPPKRVFVVPGNHDVTWDADLGLDDTEKFRAFMEAMQDFCLPEFRDGTLMPRTTDALSAITDTVGVELTLLITPTYSGIADPLGDQLLEHLERKVPHLDPAQVADFQRMVRKYRTLDVAALGSDQLDFLARLKPPARNVVRIALMHHHLVPHPQVELTTFEAVVDAGQTLQTLIAEDFDLVVHGHKHVPHLAKYTDRSRRGVHVYAGPSLFEGDNTGFALIDVYGPRGTHDIRLTQYFVDYRSRRIEEQFTRDIDRDGRVLDKVFTLASAVPTDVQENLVQPVLENITGLLAWRADYADPDLFNCIFKQLAEDVAAIGKRRVVFKPEYVETQLSGLMAVIEKMGQASLRMVSYGDLRYWIAADDPITPAHDYRMALARFQGTKSRIMIISEGLLRETTFRKEMEFVVEQMIGDGFEVDIVRENAISRNVHKDFGIYGSTAVGRFEQLSGAERRLELRFGRDDVEEHAGYWHQLRAKREARIRQKGEILNWLAKLPQ